MTWYARYRFGRQCRTWPWRVPAAVVLIGRKRPPEHVFEEFRRIHRLSERPSASGEDTA